MAVLLTACLSCSHPPSTVESQPTRPLPGVGLPEPPSGPAVPVDWEAARVAFQRERWITVATFAAVRIWNHAAALRMAWALEQAEIARIDRARKSHVTESPVGQTTGGSGVWYALAQCESGGDWGAATGNGFWGGLQFTLSSWRAVGGSGYPHHASPSEQIARGQALQRLQGWGAWPACSRKLGLR